MSDPATPGRNFNFLDLITSTGGGAADGTVLACIPTDRLEEFLRGERLRGGLGEDQLNGRARTLQPNEVFKRYYQCNFAPEYHKDRQMQADAGLMGAYAAKAQRKAAAAGSPAGQPYNVAASAELPSCSSAALAAAGDIACPAGADGASKEARSSTGTIERRSNASTDGEPADTFSAAGSAGAGPSATTNAAASAGGDSCFASVNGKKRRTGPKVGRLARGEHCGAAKCAFSFTATCYKACPSLTYLSFSNFARHTQRNCDQVCHGPDSVISAPTNRNAAKFSAACRGMCEQLLRLRVKTAMVVERVPPHLLLGTCVRCAQPVAIAAINLLNARGTQRTRMPHHRCQVRYLVMRTHAIVVCAILQFEV